MLSISPFLLVCINTVGSLHPKLLSAKTIKGASTEESILASKMREFASANLHLQELRFCTAGLEPPSGRAAGGLGITGLGVPALDKNCSELLFFLFHSQRWGLLAPPEPWRVCGHS